jgi:UDP-N-acetylglucosamine/UDP-N-acetylgalactosamine diphosphorylase
LLYCLQLSAVDIPTLLKNLEAAKNEAVKDCNALTPPPKVLKWAETAESERDDMCALGMEAICKSEVAAVIMSGGQGTRLGFKGPKGKYSIGLASGKTIFQLHMERLQKMRMLAAADTCPLDNVHIPGYIMTSITNTQAIQDYFAEMDYFNFPQEDIFFFEQGLLPCLTSDGQMIIESPDTLSMAPDGNGGIFPALKKSGAFQNMMDRQVKHLHVYGIDNVLTKSVDPGFMGFCIQNNVEVANKVVPRADASEKVGVTAVREGRMCIVEYSELPVEMTGCDVEGKLIYSAANICNHYFSVDFLADKVMFNATSMYHLAHKKIPYYNPVTKQTETPSSPNGVKLEMFVFDVFTLAERWAVMESLREDEFAPVKNAPGSATDSPDTARALLSDQAIRWLTAAGATTYDGGNDFDGDGVAIRKECEISPLLSYGGEGLDHLFGAKIPLPSFFKSPHDVDDEEDII